MSDFELSSLGNSVSRRNLLFPPSPNNFLNPVNQHSENSIEYHQTTTNIDDNQINEDQNENQNENKTYYNRFVNMYKNRSKSVLVKIPLHILLHVLLLSIFEIMLFFSFVVIMERDAFLQKLNGYFNHDTKYTFNQYFIVK